MKKICFIAPYKGLADVAAAVVDELGLRIDVHCCPIQESVTFAKEAKKKGAQILISRGGAATVLKHQLDLPVVEVKVTGYDVLRALNPYRGTSETIGIVGFENVVRGCRTICEMWGIATKEYIVVGDANHVDWQAAREEVQALIDAHQIKVVIGDNVSLRLQVKAETIQMISSGREAVVQALEEAQSLLLVQEEEKKTTEQLRMIIDFVHDGVITTDERGVVTVISPVAEKIFGVKKRDVVGKPVEACIPNTRIHKVIESKEAEVGQLQKGPTGYILTNRVPILVEDDVRGVVATFQEVSKIQDDERTIRQNLYAKGLFAKYHFSDIISRNLRMKRLIEVAHDYSQTDASVFIQGENGVGKELFAQSIHAASARAEGPFVAINCSAIPAQLLESELFGYVEGAFTGAKKGGKPGLFELAHNGTIFLDEIGDMNKDIQASLLRVLEERVVMRLGADSMLPIDVRVIAATNVDLKKHIAEGLFRMDLFYRINVLNLTIPPLRERKDDIVLLAEGFIREMSRKYKRKLEPLPKEVLALLEGHTWPGNIRELKNVMERIVISAHDGCVRADEVLAMVKDLQPYTPASGSDFPLTGTMHDLKKRIVQRVLEEEGFNKSKAAKRLGLDRGTIDRFM